MNENLVSLYGVDLLVSPWCGGVVLEGCTFSGLSFGERSGLVVDGGNPQWCGPFRVSDFDPTV